MSDREKIRYLLAPNPERIRDRQEERLRRDQALANLVLIVIGMWGVIAFLAWGWFGG